MPYRRTYRKRYVRRSRTRKGQYTRKIARREAYKAINRKTETKYIDGGVTGLLTAVDANGVMLSLHGSYSTGSFIPIVQGSNYNDYIGQWIKPTWLKFRYAFDIADSANIVTVIVVQAKGLWTNTNNMTAVFDFTGTTSAPFSNLDSTTSSRLRVLYRRQHNLNPAANDVVTGKVKLSPRMLRKMHFSDGAGGVESGLIMVGAISDSTVGPHPTMRAVWRLYYKDS